MGHLSVNEAAKICKVDTRVIRKWFDSGRLKGYRNSGLGSSRCIPRKNLREFLKEEGMPLGELEDDVVAKVLIISQDKILVDNLKLRLEPHQSFRVSAVANGSDAVIQIERFSLDCVICDFSIGHAEALQICQNLRRNAELAEVILIALLPGGGDSHNLDRSGINETLRKPFSVDLLVERLRTLIVAKKELS